VVTEPYCSGKIQHDGSGLEAKVGPFNRPIGPGGSDLDVYDIEADTTWAIGHRRRNLVLGNWSHADLPSVVIPCLGSAPEAPAKTLDGADPLHQSPYASCSLRVGTAPGVGVRAGHPKDVASTHAKTCSGSVPGRRSVPTRPRVKHREGRTSRDD
jgi:hypothetical protein